MNTIKTLLGGTILAGAMAFAPLHAGYHIGDAVQDFKLKDVDGSMKSLPAGKNIKGAIVVFTCNGCPFAKAYEERIMDLDKKYGPKGYPVVAINPNDPAIVPEDGYAEMQARAKEKKYSFPYLLDETQDVTRRFGASRTPQVFLLNKENGNWVLRYTGTIDDNYRNAKDAKEKYVEQALSELMSGKPVTTPETKALGCTIKWSKQ